MTDTKNLKETIKSRLTIEFEKDRPLGGQHCGMPINAIIVASKDLEVTIKVKHFKSNLKNKELATLLMDLTIDELVK